MSSPILPWPQHASAHSLNRFLILAQCCFLQLRRFAFTGCRRFSRNVRFSSLLAGGVIMTLRKIGWSVVFVALGMFTAPLPATFGATPRPAAQASQMPDNGSANGRNGTSTGNSTGAGQNGGSSGSSNGGYSSGSGTTGSAGGGSSTTDTSTGSGGTSSSGSHKSSHKSKKGHSGTSGSSGSSSGTGSSGGASGGGGAAGGGAGGGQ